MHIYQESETYIYIYIKLSLFIWVDNFCVRSKDSNIVERIHDKALKQIIQVHQILSNGVLRGLYCAFGIEDRIKYDYQGYFRIITL